MSGISSPADLGARLQKKAAADREMWETILREELNNYETSSRQLVQAALRSIERDTERLRSAWLWKAWLLPGVIVASGLLGICVASWATMQWHLHRIASLRQEIAMQQQIIEEQRQTLELLETQTWGLNLIGRKEGPRYIELPRGVKPGLVFEFEGRWTVPLQD